MLFELSFSELLLAYGQSYDIIVKIKCPLLLTFGFLVNDDLLEGLGELEDAIFGDGDGEKIPLILPPGWKFELENIIQLDPSLWNHILQFVKVKILELLYFREVVKSTIVD